MNSQFMCCRCVRSNGGWRVLLGAVLVVQSNSCRKEGPALGLHRLGVKQGWDLFSSIDASLSNFLLSPTPALGMGASQDRAGPLNESVKSAFEMLLPQQNTP